MSAKTDKDKQKALQDKHQAILSELLKQEDNKYCVDCDAKGPRWASWNLGIFLCIRCAGIHRNLGVHISRVKSVNLDTWTPEQIAAVQEVGNGRARAIYEANLPDNFRRPQTDSALEALIRAKYEQKKYVAKDWVPHQPSVSNSSVSDAAKKQDKKRGKSSLGDHLTEPRSLSSVKNMSDSRLAAGHMSERRDSSEPPGPAKRDVTPDRRRETEKPRSGGVAGPVPPRGRTPERRTADDLPHVELISLASPEPNVKRSSSPDFGNFIGVDTSSVATTTMSTSTTTQPTQQNASSSSADLAELDIFAGVANSGPVAAGGNGAADSAAPAAPKLATKDDIMALFGPPQTSANMYGVPGGMYMPRQPMVCQPGAAGMLPAGHPMMTNGMPMMMPAQPGAPVGPGPVGPYAMYPGYPPQMAPMYMPAQSAADGTNPAMNSWTPQQQQQMVAGHTLSNVLWQ